MVDHNDESSTRAFPFCRVEEKLLAILAKPTVSA